VVFFVLAKVREEGNMMENVSNVSGVLEVSSQNLVQTIPDRIEQNQKFTTKKRNKP